MLHRKESDDIKYSKMILKNVFSMQQEINDNRIKISKRYVTESDGKGHKNRVDVT